MRLENWASSAHTGLISQKQESGCGCKGHGKERPFSLEAGAEACVPLSMLINKSSHILNLMEKVNKSSPVKKYLEPFIAQSVYTPLSTLINPLGGT